MSESGVALKVRARLSAKNFDNSLSTYTFDPGTHPEKLPATLGVSTNGVAWLLVAVRGGRYGWPLVAVNRLIDTDQLRVYVHGEEQDDTSAL